MNTVPIGVPIPFTVTALEPNLAPAGGVTVIYTVTSGSATLACGLPVCSVTATGDGRATMNVDRSQQHVVHRHRFAHQRLQPPGAVCGRHAAFALGPHAAAFARCRRHLHLDRTGSGALERRSRRQSVGGLANRVRQRHHRPGSAAALTNSSGIATNTLTVGPLAEGQTASINACLNGTSQCVAFTAYGARPEYALLEPVSGTSQSLAASGTPSQIALRLLDMDGNPMAGGTVALYQALYAWSPPCSPNTVCTQGALLATQASTATSAVDGTVIFMPASLPGVATNLLGLAASGNTATVKISIEQHP